ncbi:MAG: hypothetical protein ACTSWQ_07290 [Candidatus Thorarchaeota archaeon]
MNEDAIHGAIAAKIYEKYGSVFLTRDEMLTEIRVSRSTFDKMEAKQVAPRISRVPSDSGTGKRLYHVGDIAKFKFEKEKETV